MCYNVSYFYNLGGLNVSLHKDFVLLHKSRLNIFRRVFTNLSRFCMFTGISPIGGLFNFRKCPKAKLNCTCKTLVTPSCCTICLPECIFSKCLLMRPGFCGLLLHKGQWYLLLVLVQKCSQPGSVHLKISRFWSFPSTEMCTVWSGLLLTASSTSASLWSNKAARN